MVLKNITARDKTVLLPPLKTFLSLYVIIIKTRFLDNNLGFYQSKNLILPETT